MKLLIGVAAVLMGAQLLAAQPIKTDCTFYDATTCQDALGGSVSCSLHARVFGTYGSQPVGPNVVCQYKGTWKPYAGKTFLLRCDQGAKSWVKRLGGFVCGSFV